MRRLITRAALALAAVLAVPAAAQNPLAAIESPSPTPAASAAATAIDTGVDAGSDARIAKRLSGILGELPAFSQVRVTVREGVVTLAGTVPQEADVARAEAIATRITGVVTVENTLTRDVSIDGNAAVGGIAAKLAGFVRLLPLLGLALAVWLAIGVVGYVLAGLGHVWQRLAPNSFLAELIASAIRFVFVLGGLAVALDILGATALLGAVLGGAGLVGVALGFAMRDTIENYVASLMLSLRQPFRANDHVVIEGSEGRVIRLTSRATVLMTLDGNHLRIPNSTVFKATILNFTRNPKRRFEFQLGIDADDDPDAARRLGRETLAGLPFVLDDPAPEARTEEVGDSNILLKFLGWVDQDKADWWKARSRAIAAVKAALENGGFALPEPIYRLRFDERTGILPFEQVSAEKMRPHTGAPEPERAPAQTPAPTADATAEDIRPASEIADMVDDERRAGGDGGQEADLLDSSKPVE